MDTASFQFVTFGLVVVLLSNCNQSRRWRSSVLFFASIFFVCLLAHSLIATLPLASFLLLGYAGYEWLERGGSGGGAWCILAVVLAYVWLKKYAFLPEGVLLRSPYFTLGLSYIFFRVLHLLIEAGEGRKKDRLGPGAYLLYTLNFTTLLSGPIQRYDEFARDQFAVQPIALGLRVIGLQLERIVRGFFKVNVLAMLFDRAQEHALVQMSLPLPWSLKFFAAFELIVVYPLFLYANFSGYIDIVIALARLMRIRLPENFDRPFSASSVLEFWSRWHMTLSDWFKTYVYNPLLMVLMRRSSSVAAEPLLGVFCFFVTFFLVGIWHGRTTEFVFYGLLQGTGISINKLWQIGLARGLGRKRYKALANHAVYIAWGRGLSFCWFALTLFWFWGRWEQLGKVFSGVGTLAWLGVWLAVFICATVVLALWEWLHAALLSMRTVAGPVVTSRYARVIYASALGLAALVMTILMSQPAPGIVYQAF